MYLCGQHRSRGTSCQCAGQDGRSHSHPGWERSRSTRGVSCFGTKGTATADSKNITTGKAGLPKQLERLFPLDQFISELISSSYVSSSATAIVNTSHWILLRKAKGPSTDLLHGNSHYPTAWSLCGSCRNKFIFVSSTTGNKNN